MATPRRSSLPTAVRSLRTARRITLVLVGLAVVALSPLPAQADPDPTTSGDAATLMAARAHDLEKITEQFNAARDQLAAQQAKAEAAQKAFQDAQAALVQARQQVRGIARSAYTGDSSSLAALLTSRSASDFVGKVSTLEQLGTRQTAVLEQVQKVSDAAGQAEATAQKVVAQARATFDSVKTQQDSLQAQVSKYQADYNRLSAQERQATMTAAQGGDQAASRGVDRSAPAIGPVTAPSGAAQIAVNTALAQRGKPYVWAAAGPGSFDCSGLTLYAYAAAGIRLPHNAEMQAGMGRPVSAGQLAPGDLIFYYSPIEHVAMYIGNGQVVHAPTFGDVVKIAPMNAVGSPTAMVRLAG
jgi:cell wall-associated NlpC family hydrolase